MSSSQEEIERPIRDVRMTDFSSPEFNTTYSVEVAIKNTNGSYLPYGSLCTVTTPSFPTTQLQDTQCDVVITTMSTTIYADSYSGASTYRFKFVNGAFTYTFDRPNRSFNMNTVPGLVSGATYSVQVALEINGVFGPYGKVCTITTPSFVAKYENVEMNDSKGWNIVAYPNPFENNLKLEIISNEKEMISLKIYDMLGNIIENRVVETAEIQQLEIGSNYPSGIYNVIISQGDWVKNVRIIKR